MNLVNIYYIVNIDKEVTCYAKQYWKQKDEKYLFYLQKFLDISENINDETLKMSVIGAMLKCDERLTKLAEYEIENMNKKDELMK